MTWTTRPRSKLGQLRAISAGDGPLVLLIHGVGLRAEAWNMQADALSGHFRTLAVDMPGHGESPMLEHLSGLADYTDAIAAELNETALVIGHSMGALIGLDMAARYPDLVQGVAALNAVFRRSEEAAQAINARVESMDGVTVADPSGTLHRWFGDTRSPERDACERWLTSINPAAYRTAYSLFARESGADPTALAKLSCPALFMTGEEEPNSTPEMSDAMAKLAPSGRSRIVESAAHMMPMTHGQEVNAALLAFAQKVWS